ncbi:MAG: glycosyl hydrolase family 17 protein [Desulfobaccales bacterium]
MQRRAAVVIMVIALALGLAVGQALAQTIGVDYGPYHKPGQAPGFNIPDAQFISDLRTIATKFGYVKTYGSDPVLARIVPLIQANSIPLKVAVGIFESSANRDAPDGTNAQIAAAIAIAQNPLYAGIVNMVVVGNECIAGPGWSSTPNPVPVSTLIADLNTVKAALPGVTVTTDLTYQAGLDLNGPLSSLLPVIDNVMVNIYPFYGQVAIDGALANLTNAYGLFSGHGKPVWVGETGWPSAGAQNGAAIPSVPNEQKFTSDVLGADLPYAGIYLFEAFDELWKTDNSWEQHWGLWDQNGIAKFNIGAPPTNSVPIPGSLLLLGSGLLGLVPFRYALGRLRSSRQV